jgi:hypothetical protein
MKLPVKVWLAVVVLLGARAPVAACNLLSPLSHQVTHFSIGKTTVLDALIWLGRDEQICFGIEFYGDLSRVVQIS